MGRDRVKSADGGGGRKRGAAKVWAMLGGAILAVACHQHYEPGSHPPRPPRDSGLPAGHPPLERPSEAPRPMGMTPASATSSASGQTAPEGAVTGTIRIAPELAGEIPRNATLFIIARDRQDGGAPYAVRRLPVPPMPYRFELSQADVIPMFGDGIQFADIPEMHIAARIDRDGSIGPMESGDLEGVTREPVAAGQQGVEILIDREY